MTARRSFLGLHLHRETGEFHCIPDFIINNRTVSRGQVFAT
jgi:hypothetical protein